MLMAIEFPVKIDLFEKTFLLHPFMEGLGMFIGMHLGDQYKRHPVALYEIAFLLFLFIGLQLFKRRFMYRNGVLGFKIDSF